MKLLLSDIEQKTAQDYDPWNKDKKKEMSPVIVSAFCLAPLCRLAQWEGAQTEHSSLHELRRQRSEFRASEVAGICMARF